jgi:glycosyltransferase involved in cell wall biosynthesis
MRVAIHPDPVLFDRPGGLRTQVRETMAALARHGVEASLASGAGGHCDLLHVFGAAHADGAGRAAGAARVPVLLSARVSPAWSSVNGTRARVADRVMGNRSAWDFDTGYARIRRALHGADLVIAQSEAERRAICRAFLVEPERVRLVGSGIGARFFDAGPEPCRARLRIGGPFALMVGQVSPWHGQLELAGMLAGLALPLVVVGAAHERDTAYLAALRALRTVRCIGPLAHDDPLLASAYAAAAVLVLPPHGAALPMAALEALAAGTPVISAGAPGQPRPVAGVVSVAREGMAQAISQLLAAPPAREAIRAGVRGFTWDAVALQLVGHYSALLAAAR